MLMKNKFHTKNQSKFQLQIFYNIFYLMMKILTFSIISPLLLLIQKIISCKALMFIQCVMTFLWKMVLYNTLSKHMYLMCTGRFCSVKWISELNNKYKNIYGGLH